MNLSCNGQGLTILVKQLITGVWLITYFYCGGTMTASTYSALLYRSVLEYVCLRTNTEIRFWQRSR